MHRKLITTTLGFVFLLGISGSAAEAAPLNFKFYKANVPGAMATIPVGINNGWRDCWDISGSEIGLARLYSRRQEGDHS